MSKHLLKQLLGLETTGTDSDKDTSGKLARYYSTDKGRYVVTRVPEKVKIIHKQPDYSTITSNITTYSDDLSDVSGRLLNKVLQSNRNNKTLTYTTPYRTSNTTSHTGDSSANNSSLYSKTSNLYSRGSIYSKDFDDISSYKSDSSSYDSFFDMYSNNDASESEPTKDTKTFSDLVSDYDLDDLPKVKSPEPFNIFRSQHRR